MKLRPVHAIDSPGYPLRPPQAQSNRPALRGLRHLALSVLLGLAACSGDPGHTSTSAGLSAPAAQTTVHDDNEEKQQQAGRSVAQCQPQYRLSGIAAPTNVFSCGSGGSAVHQFPYLLGAGQTCGSQPSRVLINVSAPSRATVSFNSMPTNTKITLIAPDGIAAAEISPTQPCLQLNVEPGIWTLIATPITAGGNQNERFEIVFATL